MKRRILIAMCTVTLCAAAFSSLLISIACYRAAEARLKAEVREKAAYLAAAFSLSGEAYLTETANLAGRVTLISENGTVLFESHPQSNTESRSGRKEFKEALSEGVGEDTRVSQTTGERTFYYALKLTQSGGEPGGEPGGFVVLRLSAPAESWLAQLAGLWPLLLLAASLALGLSMLLAGFLTRRIVAPLNSLRLDEPSQSVTYGELSPLLSKIERQNDVISRQMQALRQNQREFAAITENMSEGFLVIDKNAAILSYNQSALRQLGAEPAAVAAQSAFVLNRSEGFRRAVEAALAGQKNEQTLTRDNRFYSLIASPVAEGKAVAGAVLLVLDVTERRERESLRREFTTNVSHELKTPLTSISGFAEIIKTGLVRKEDIARFAGKIYDEAQRLIALVGDIIKLSQLDENSVPFEREPVDLAALAGEVIRHLRDAAAAKSVSLYQAGGPAVVVGVPSILEEMLYNLCDNAVKYNREKGSATVTTGQNEQGVFISVADTGIGIPQSQQDRVFERFYRAEKSHSKEVDGTGLGLSIVKHGAAFHGATVRLESAEGQGTTVTITWPPAEA